MIQAIFLSYASQDADAARRICEALRAAGLEVWFDQSELRGGDAWDTSIRKQIKECALFVPIISATTNARSEGYFRLEWKLAVERSHLMAESKPFFVPIIIDDTSEPSANVPDAFRARQWSRLNNDKSIAAFAERVGKLVADNSVLSVDAPKAPPVLATSTLLPHHREEVTLFSESSLRTQRPMMGYKSALLVLAAIIFIAGTFVAAQHFTSADNKPIQSIAVMPFVNDSGNADFEYLSDGMTETLIGTLSQLPKLSVNACSTVFRYKGKDINPQTIGKELGVQAVLNGRLVQRGDDITLNLELVEVQKENVIWSKPYSRRKPDLVALQIEIARDVSSELKTKLPGADSAKVSKTYTANPEAYQLYLKGRFFWNKRTAETLKQAAEFFKQAIEKDPGYALAYAGLADTYLLFSGYYVAPGLESFPKAKAAAMQALALDDSLAQAHTTLAFYLNEFESNWESAEKEFRRAIALGPNYATARHWYGFQLAGRKRFDESLAELRIAESLDPFSPIIGASLGDSLYLAGRYDAAMMQYHRVLALNDNFGAAHCALGRALHAKKMYPEAIAAFRKAISLQSQAEPFLAISLLKLGQPDEAAKMLNEFKRASAQSYIRGYRIAVVALAPGDKEEALAWLEKEMADHSDALWLYAVDPYLDDLRSEPRFKAILKRLNLPE